MAQTPLLTLYQCENIEFFSSKNNISGFHHAYNVKSWGQPIYMPVNVDSAPSSKSFIHDPMTLILIIFFYHCYLFYRLHPASARWEKKSERDCHFRQGLRGLWPWFKTSPPSGFVHKVSLSSYPHSFTYCSWLLLDYRGRDEELRRRSLGLQSLTYLLSGPLQIKFDGPWFRLFLIKKKLKSILKGHNSIVFFFLNPDGVSCPMEISNKHQANWKV